MISTSEKPVLSALALAYTRHSSSASSRPISKASSKPALVSTTNATRFRCSSCKGRFIISIALYMLCYEHDKSVPCEDILIDPSKDVLSAFMKHHRETDAYTPASKDVNGASPRSPPYH